MYNFKIVFQINIFDCTNSFKIFSVVPKFVTFMSLNIIKLNRHLDFFLVSNIILTKKITENNDTNLN